MHALEKNLILFHWVLLINMNLEKNILTKTCIACKKGPFLIFLAHCRHFCQNMFFLFTLIKSTQWNHLRFFPRACTRIFNNINFRLQGLQIGAFQQRYLKCKCETPYFEGELVSKTCINWKMSSKKNFLSGYVTKLENLFVFGKNLWKISSNWWFQKSCWPILLRLNYWKSVVR